ncbi:MAG: hypothetical protein EBR82_75820 [Caulobacteraceae bacterium]|nr:hypothetical protein [Caulobacteraceae bacterium]
MMTNSDKLIHPKYPLLSWLRIVGNAFFIVGYAVILFNSVEIGIYCRLFGNLVSFPYFYKVKMWDMMTIRSFFAIIEMSKLIQIFFFGAN